jgi:hypothetical protein
MRNSSSLAQVILKMVVLCIYYIWGSRVKHIEYYIPTDSLNRNNDVFYDAS